MKFRLPKITSGFTLIELLVVIAILGILGAAVLVALDPLEQLSRGRDAGRKSSVAQLGKAVQSYYTVNQAFPAVATWNTSLVSSGEIKVFPTAVTGSAACTVNVINGYCYTMNGTSTEFVVYTRLESKAEKNKITPACAPANIWYVFSSLDGKAGTYCNATAPDASAALGVNLL